ncbi:MAG: hypothetical protein JSV41_04870 [Gemmatimonadota bacterium]|nr:MAG: hypothetical protein JSV41_04870 [Gemmatimonadota bacterium]
MSPTQNVAREPGRLAAVQGRLLAVAESSDYEGYSKHDALNSPWLAAAAGESKWLRLAITQAVMRSPLHVRPLLGVRTARNAKGISLFARALLARYRVYGQQGSAEAARRLLAWLADPPASEFPWPAWGYPYPWQDVGFFAPRDFPNRVVTSFVVQALLDGYDVLGEKKLLDVAREMVDFLLQAPRTLYEDDRHRCVSYVPSDTVDWIVLDVPALTGAVAARLAAIRQDTELMREAGRLLRYVVSKQTDYAAWYYADPPSASHITHDNYHTGFILDALLEYGRWAESDEFEAAYRRGLRFYRERLFESDGAPRFMHDRKYPLDIHGAAQGIITFAKAQQALGEGCDFSRRVLGWALRNMYDSRTGWFYYQRRHFFRTPIRLLRWCQAWMAWAIGCHVECCGELPCE